MNLAWVAQGAPHAAIYTPIHLLPATIEADEAKHHEVDAMPPSLTSGSLHRTDACDSAPEASPRCR